MKYHFCRIYIEKKYLYRVLNACKNITIRNIKKENDEASFEINYSDREYLITLLQNENIPLVREKQYGYFSFFKFNKLKLVLSAAIIIVLILYINSRYIWNISVEGNYSYSAPQIISYVHKNGFKEGMLKSDVDCENLENKIRLDYNDISWVSCEIKGTNLIIHMKENYIADISKKEKKPYHIVSNVSGKIVSVVTRNGTAKVKAGDKVKKNAILVSGKIDVFDESEQKLFSTYCNADADITAKVVHNYSDEISKEYLSVNKNHKKTYYLPSVNNYYWKIKHFDDNFTEKSLIKLKLYDNYYMPLCINKITVYKDKPVNVTLTKKQAKERLEHKMLYYFANLEQKGYKILEKDVKIKENKKNYILSGTFTCIEPIGKVKYIDMKKEEKEEAGETTSQ